MNDHAIEITDPQRAEIRTRANLASEVVAPYWPLRTFISRNPLLGFQNRPFEEAVDAATRLTGGRGYAPLADYHAWYQDGKIGEAELEAAIRARIAVADETIDLAGHAGSLPAVEVARLWMLENLAEPDPIARAAELDDGLPWRLAPDLSAATRAQLMAGETDEAAVAAGLWRALDETLGDDEPPDPIRDPATLGARMLADDLAALGRSTTLADWCDRILGTRIRDEIGNLMIHWVAGFLDEGQAVWSMPERERGLYACWRYLARWERTQIPGGGPMLEQIADALPADPEDAIIWSLRRLGIPRGRWQGHMAAHCARQPGWAGLVRWRSNNPDTLWQQRHPASPTKYLAIVLTLEAEAVAAACRRCLGIAGDLGSIERYFAERPAEYLVRRRLGDADLPPELKRRARRMAKAKRPPVEAAWSDLATAIEAAGERLGSGRRTERLWPLYMLAQHLGWRSDWIRDQGSARLRRIARWLEALAEHNRAAIWLDASERSYRGGLLGAIAGAYAHPADASAARGDTSRPLAQAMFCIDVRSEPFRRALENLGGYETYGVAGFFGVPFRFQAFNSHYHADLCPVLLRPNHQINELPRPSEQSVDKHLSGSRISHGMRHLLHDLKGHVVAPFVAVEAIGWAFGLPFVLKTAAPRWYHGLATRIERWFVPRVSTALTVDKLTKDQARNWVAHYQRARISQALRIEYSLRRRALVSSQTLEALRQAALAADPHDDNPEPRTELARALGLDAAGERDLLKTLRERYEIDTKHSDALLYRVSQTGFTDDEQVYSVEAALRLIGLTDQFARLVLVCGHASHSDNNPYESALDCGACGGDHGRQNARVLAHMANRPVVRERLRARGIDIPNDCWFVAGEHNTTTDRVELFDLETVPISHRQELALLENDLYEAGTRCARERCRRLPDAPDRRDPKVGAAHVELRSVDWTQVRPEWGLSGNAAFVIARRAAIRELNLDGRAFLHSYDYRSDPQGRALENIMTAPLVVAHWINMEYYFSSADNAVYGSGSKVYHNVAGLVGVMSGNYSDLRIGLPSQTIAAGGRLYHEPMRLLAVVEAPRERVRAIVQRNNVLGQMFHNEWARLATIEPDSGRIYLYQANGEFTAWPEEHQRAPVCGEGSIEEVR